MPLPSENWRAKEGDSPADLLLRYSSLRNRFFVRQFDLLTNPTTTGYTRLYNYLNQIR
jgi:hypothetical protein